MQGTGGIGKTVLAVEVAWQLFDEGVFPVVLFITADSARVLRESLAGLVEKHRLNLPEEDVPGIDDRYRAVMGVAAGHQESRQVAHDLGQCGHRGSAGRRSCNCCPS